MREYAAGFEAEFLGWVRAEEIARMERSRGQLPVEPGQRCSTCGEPLVVDAGELVPIGSAESIHINDGAPYCPNGHEPQDVGGEG